MPDPERSGMALRDYLSVTRRRKWVIILSVVVVAATALLLSSLQTPVYEGKARLLLQPTASLFDEVAAPIGPAQARTEIEVLTSAAVTALVRERIGRPPKVSAEQLGDTQVIVIRAQSTSADRAAEVATAYAQAYIDYRRTQTLDSLSTAGAALQSRVDELNRQIAEYDAAHPPPTNLPPGASPPRSAERENLESQRFFFRQKLEQLNVDAQLKNGGSQMLAQAAVPREPVRPQPIRNAALGITAGLIFGIAMAFSFEHLDDSIKVKEDLEHVARDIAVVGVIPAVAGWRNRAEPRLVARADPSSPEAEAYRTLRTSIQFLGLDRSLKALQITSPSAGEGKTTTIANLAVTLAQAGRRVVVVSCDLRRPRIHEFFGLSNAVGFTSLLLGEAPPSAVLQDVPDVGRLKVLASGPLPPNPSELLAAPRTAEVLKALTESADIVLIDSPPILPVTDAAVLATRVDGTLIIASAGQTNKRPLARAIELLRQVNAPIVGAVLNAAPAEAGYGYAYQYYRRAETAVGNGQESAKRGSRAGSKR